MYYLLTIQNAGESGSSTSIMAYNDRDAVFAAFHTEMAYRHESRLNTVCMIMDEYGLLICRETYGLPIE